MPTATRPDAPPTQTDAAVAGAPPSPDRRRAAMAVAAWAALVVVAHLWGRHLLDSGLGLKLGPGDGAPPIVGRLDLRLGWRIVPALAVAATGLAYGPRLAARLRWRHLLAAAAAGAAVWALALAFIEPGEWSAPLLNHGEYLHDIGRVGNPFTFLAHFTDRIADYQIHTEGHPPGMVLFLAGLDAAGLRGANWAAVFVIAAGAAAVPATLVTARALGGEASARPAAPFLVMAPAAIWAATTADGMYMGVMAAGIALLAVAGGDPDGRRSDRRALGAGVVLGLALFLTYGAVLMVAVAVAVAVAQRRLRPLYMAGAGAAAVVAAFAAAGFWWVDGLGATRVRYFDGVASVRPYSYFLVANLAAFALVVGPAVPVALTRLRRTGPWLLVVGGLAAVALADLSGMSKAEVERIWLPFAPWILLATFTLASRTATTAGTAGPAARRWAAGRGWLALQAGVALALSVGVLTPW